jgi:isopropylmalate/homocitrate/citramalate synthase
MNYYDYGKVHNLIEVNEIKNVSYTRSVNNEVVVMTDGSKKSTYIEINNIGYIVENDKLFKILSKYKCKKSKKEYFPYTSDDIVVEIYLTQNHKPKHILLGKFNIWYESSDKKVYDIMDGDKLLNEILLFVKK